MIQDGLLNNNYYETGSYDSYWKILKRLLFNIFLNTENKYVQLTLFKIHYSMQYHKFIKISLKMTCMSLISIQAKC